MRKKNDFIGRLIKIEDGYVNNEADLGGETRFGITKATAREHGYRGEMKYLPMDTAFQIYATTYWDANSLSDMLSLSEKITEEVFDTGVNMGTPMAGVFLQRCLNVLNVGENTYDNLKVDGIVGNRTLSALADYLGEREEGEEVLLKMLNSLQGSEYISIAENDEEQESFVYGWFRKRVGC